MIQVSTEIANALSQLSREFDAKIYVNGSAVDCEIMSLKLHKGACGKFTVGSIFIPYVELTVNGTTTLTTNTEFELKIAVKVNGSFGTYYRVGYFTPTSIENGHTQTEIYAQGRLADTNRVLFSTEPTARSLNNILTAIRNKGYTVDIKGLTIPTASIDQLIPLIGLSVRDGLGLLASCSGGYVTEDSNGHIVLGKFELGTPVMVNPDALSTYPTVKGEYELTGITVKVSESIPPYQIPTAEAVKNFQIENPYFNSDMVSTFTSNTIGYTFNVTEMPIALGDFRFEPWDCVGILGGGLYPSNILYPSDNLYPLDDYVVFTAPCLALDFDFDGGLKTTIKAEGELPQEKSTKTAGPFTAQLDEAYDKAVAANNLANQVQTDLDENYSDTEAMNAAIEEGMEIAEDYSDGKLQEFIEGDFADLSRQVDGKIVTYYQSAAPTAHDIGDIWYCTATTGTYANKTWRWSGTAWQEISAVPDSVFDEIDGKATVYYQTTQPSTGSERDIWVDSDDPQKQVYVYYNNSWMKMADYTDAIQAAKDRADAAYEKAEEGGDTTYTRIQYAKGTVSQATGTWSYAIPDLTSSEPYLWIRYVTVKRDATTGVETIQGDPYGTTKSTLMSGAYTFVANNYDAKGAASGAVSDLESALSRGATTINGGCITTGEINTSVLNIQEIGENLVCIGSPSGDHVSVGSGSIGLFGTETQLEISSGTMSLSYNASEVFGVSAGGTVTKSSTVAVGANKGESKSAILSTPTLFNFTGATMRVKLVTKTSYGSSVSYQNVNLSTSSTTTSWNGITATLQRATVGGIRTRIGYSITNSYNGSATTATVESVAFSKSVTADLIHVANDKFVVDSNGNVRADGTISGSNIPSGTILTSSNYSSYADYTEQRVKCAHICVSSPTTATNSDMICQASADTSDHKKNDFCIHTTSSREIKNAIEPIKDIDCSKLYDIEVVQFKYNTDYLGEGDERYDTLVPGFIAEQVDEVFPVCADHKNGKAYNWNLYFMIPAMLKLIQDQHKEIELLKERINGL